MSQQSFIGMGPNEENPGGGSAGAGRTREVKAMDSIQAMTPALKRSYGNGALSRLSSFVIEVTPELAAQWIAERKFDRQRKIDPKNVERLASEMTNGWFVAGTPIFVCILPDGRMLQVNGNHTLRAVVKSGVTVPLTVIYRHVQNEDEAGEIYAVIDYQKVRTKADGLKAMALEDGPLVSEAMSAMSFLLTDFRDKADSATAKSQQRQHQELKKYENALALLYSAWKNAKGKSVNSENVKALQRGPFMAVAMATARYSPSLALEFWGGAARNDGLASTDPRGVLLNFAKGAKTGGTDRRMLAVQYSAATWNAFYEGDSRHFVQPARLKGENFRLLGTPWHRGAKPSFGEEG